MAKKNTSNIKIIGTAIVLVGVLVGLVLLQNPNAANIFPQAARKTAQVQNPNARREKAIQVLNNTPAVTKKADLLTILGKVDSSDVSEVAQGLEQNEQDAEAF